MRAPARSPCRVLHRTATLSPGPPVTYPFAAGGPQRLVAVAVACRFTDRSGPQQVLGSSLGGLPATTRATFGQSASVGARAGSATRTRPRCAGDACYAI